MTTHCIYRWVLLFIFGLPVQLLTYAAHIFLLPYYLFYAKKKLVGKRPIETKKRWEIKDLISRSEKDSTRNVYYLFHPDEHTALVHMYFWIIHPELALQGLRGLVDTENSTLFRRMPIGGDAPISGDCIASWVCALSYRVHHGLDIPKKELRIITDSYIKHCLGLPAKNLDYRVSNRSSNGGMSYTPDSWGGINQPCFGPQYYTSAGLLALAVNQLGGRYRLYYWIHFIGLGGWLYWLVPLMHPHKAHWHYVQHITTISVYSVAVNTKNPIYKWTLWWLTKFMMPRQFLDPLLECWRADLGWSSKRDKEDCLKKCERIKRRWPQVWTGREDWYTIDKDTNHFSLVAGAAKLLQSR